VILASNCLSWPQCHVPHANTLPTVRPAAVVDPAAVAMLGRLPDVPLRFENVSWRTRPRAFRHMPHVVASISREQ
jgi:hypothetical protein